MPKIVEAEELISRFSYLGRPCPRSQILEQVGPGWRPSVSKLMDDLLELGWDGSVSQVKEKFGGLRFYVGFNPTLGFGPSPGLTIAMDDLIDKAQEQSFFMCEDCGKPGRTDGWGGMWVKTLCDTHGKALEAEHDGQQDP